MHESTWDHLLVDTHVTPPAIDDARFRDWLLGQRIFISSTMDAEMNPYRDAVRMYLEKFGVSVPVMWETITPVDSRPVPAYIDGVNRATLFVLMLGKRYGVPDDSGYSPTHQESNHAGSRHLHRLLFTLAVARSERDGKLNDWLGALYRETSGIEVASPVGLVAQLDARLRDLAARAQRYWIKLGSCVFLGRVDTESDGYGRSAFSVVARTNDPRIRRSLTGMSGRSEPLTLTWEHETHAIRVERVKTSSEYAGETNVVIECRTPQHGEGEPGGTFRNMNVNGLGPAELTRRWVKHAIFGEAQAEITPHGFLDVIATAPMRKSLPAVIAACGVRGWQAEGIVHLYAVEELWRDRGARFDYLKVGPATAAAVPLEGVYRRDSDGNLSEPVRISGAVPIRT